MNFIKKRERKSRKSISFCEYLPRTEFFKEFIFFGQSLFTRMFGCFSVKKIIAIMRSYNLLIVLHYIILYYIILYHIKSINEKL